MDDEGTEPLSIGSIFGGHTHANSGWRASIRDLGERVAEARVGVETPLNVNIVFHVPGHILQPDFSGVRTGSYSKADRALIVQVALPESAPRDAFDHLRAAATQALDEAERWAIRKRVADSLRELREVLAGA